MGRTMYRAACGVLVVATAAYASGCVFLLGGAAVGAAVMYAKGEGKKAYAEPLDKTRDAVLAALTDLSLPVLHKDQDAVSARVESTTSDGKDITVVLTRESDAITMARIRVGTFGDQTFTRALFDAIDKRLGV